MPLTEFSGFVLVEAKMNAQRNFAVLEDIGEIQIGRRIVGRIASEDCKQIYFPCDRVGSKFFDGLVLIYRICVDRVGVEDCLPDISQSLIHCVSESMNATRLMIAHNHNARSAMGGEILK